MGAGQSGRSEQFARPVARRNVEGGNRQDDITHQSYRIVLGARTPKHPDYLDLFIAMTGRAPLAGVYLGAERRPGDC